MNAIHKVEFQLADKGNGVEVTLPSWAIILSWWGTLIMKPLPTSDRGWERLGLAWEDMI